MARSTYNTKQRDEIITFLKSIKGKDVTANDIHNYFMEKGITVGLTTIYRCLDKLIDEGSVNKYTLKDDRCAYYEYVQKEECHEVCFHFKCVKCGRLIHLDCHDLIATKTHLENEHGFILDTKKTVFYGLCNECKGLL